MVIVVLHGLMSLSMTCAGCGFEILAGFAFCPRCGRRQPVGCASCGFACEPDFAFCPRCGSPREPAAAAKPKVPQADADRRQVTVIFADVCGFTSLSERLDPEEVRAFQGALFDSLGQAITRYGGFVAKYLGDAVLALFGAPVAHEDDPERALDAALDMLRRAAALSGTWAARLGQPVSLHVAVHTGPVVAGSLGDGAGAAYDVTGDTVNTASRLLGEAAPGTILVAASTQALTRHRFAFEPAGAVVLRGKSEPMVVHRLLGALADPQSARGLATLGLAGPLVGRNQELGRLLRGLRAHAGRQRAGREPGRRSRHRQVAADRRVPRSPRGGWPFGRDRRAARQLLVARRADLRRLRCAVPRRLRSGAGRSTRGGAREAGAGPAARWAPRPGSPRRSRRC